MTDTQQAYLDLIQNHLITATTGDEFSEQHVYIANLCFKEFIENINSKLLTEKDYDEKYPKNDKVKSIINAAKYIRESKK